MARNSGVSPRKSSLDLHPCNLIGHELATRASRPCSSSTGAVLPLSSWKVDMRPRELRHLSANFITAPSDWQATAVCRTGCLANACCTSVVGNVAVLRLHYALAEFCYPLLLWGLPSVVFLGMGTGSPSLCSHALPYPA